MSKIILQRKEKCVISDKFYIVENGSISVYDIFKNGKYLPKETCFRPGEIVGNFFKYFPNKNLPLPEIEVEVIAMEDSTVLEEFKFESTAIEVNLELSKIIIQLLKENIFKLFYHIYDKEGYLLAILKFYADDDGILIKDYIHYSNFLMSKSKFYTTYGILKDKKYIKETKKNIQLNLKKIDKYFNDIFS